MIRIYNYHSPLGVIVLAKENKDLIGVWFEEQKYFGSTLNSSYQKGTAQQFEDVIEWLDTYFSGQIPIKIPRLKLHATPFRQDVLTILQTIPYGQTTTYKEIAQLVCQKRNMTSMALQAIGGAIAHNPIALIIPCHRVIGTNGKLIGYAGGLEKKAHLLAMEHQKSVYLEGIKNSIRVRGE